MSAADCNKVPVFKLSCFFNDCNCVQAQTASTDESASLEIPKCVRGDTGKYLVTVENENGSDTAEIPVIVLGKVLHCITIDRKLCSHISL